MSWSLLPLCFSLSFSLSGINLLTYLGPVLALAPTGLGYVVLRGSKPGPDGAEFHTEGLRLVGVLVQV